MPKFRKKPIVIEAIKWTGSNIEELTAFTFGFVSLQREGFYLIIPTLEGDHKANPGDWIIKGVKGEFYPCKPDIFIAIYDIVLEDA